MAAEFAGIKSSRLAKVIDYGIFSGGKRIRPLLTVLVARLVAFTRMPEGIADEEDLSPPADLYRLAMVFEFLHAASLLHDDVIDHADTRRGKKTANQLWDASTAILAGDYLHTRAMTLAGLVGGDKALATIGEATSAMIDAEFLQAQTVADSNLSEENYFAVLRGKTGALIGAACEVGALFSGANKEQRAAIRTFGDALGLAFQLVDDLLDYLGDPDTTGKATGNDFVEGKMTLPLIYAIENSSADKRKILTALLAGEASQRQSKISEVTAIIDECSGFSYARQGADTLITAALESLHSFKECDTRDTLEGLAHYVLSRNK
ncbi:MAG: polyprenyl synthetase family protein [Proteobacteria bacterium]|nr:polyprenyl synthetase family protein [Pseudomonadota bacterium]MBU1641414.1 polyprenyl synthetase family protein [Pseudomonadota bacterium]